MAKTQKFVLLTDVVGSRHIANRKKFERQLSETLKAVEESLGHVFQGAIKQWKGLDELAALLRQPERLQEVMNALNAGIAPQKMRFVLVKGEVDLPAKEGDVSTADGPVFHQAAGMMVELKKSGLQFDCATGDSQRDELWRTQVNLILMLKSTWTEQQHKVYGCYAETGVQEGVAKTLKISQQAVSKTLKSIGAQQVRLLEKKVQNWIQSELTKK